MSMNPEPENFESLRRLLALKRHEQPPPGYFDRFHREVMVHVRSGEGAMARPEGLGWEIPWLQRLWAALETKPIFAGAFGLAVCGLLAAGIVFSERTEPMTITVIPGPQMATHPSQAADQPDSYLVDHALAWSLSSTGGVTSGELRDSLFRDARRPQIERINFTPQN